MDDGRSAGFLTSKLRLTPPVGQKPMPASVFLSKSFDLYITHMCNLRCKYCYLLPKFLDKGDDKNDPLRHMSLERAKNIYAYMKAGGMEEVVLLGGEPSLHPQFAEMIVAADAAGLRVRVVTNGHKNFRTLLRNNVQVRDILRRGSVSVSLDTPDKQLFDSFRVPKGRRDGRSGGVSAFKEATEMIDLLRDLSVPFQINATLTSSMVGTVQQMMEFADRSGAQLLNIHWYSKMGSGAEFAADEVPTPEQWGDVLLRVMMYQPERAGFKVDCELSYWYAVIGADPNMCLLRDYGNIQILPQGEAYGCGAAMDAYDSAYYWFDGDDSHPRGVYVRPSSLRNELTVVTNSEQLGCPIREHAEGQPVPLCIYNRDARVQSGQKLAGTPLLGNNRFIVPGGYRHLDRSDYFRIVGRVSFLQAAGVRLERARQASASGQLGVGDESVSDAEARYLFEGETLVQELASHAEDVQLEIRDGGIEWFSICGQIMNHRPFREVMLRESKDVADAMRGFLHDYSRSAIHRQAEVDLDTSAAIPLFEPTMPIGTEGS